MRSNTEAGTNTFWVKKQKKTKGQTASFALGWAYTSRKNGSTQR